MKLSAVINTRNEAANIIRCLHSVVAHVDEVVVVDMESRDGTAALARKYTKRIYRHKYLGYVEPARNFAIAKASGDWVLVIDADEILPESLGLRLRQLIEGKYNFYRIPRKNLIFGRWIQHSGWWPDYQIRLFKKDSVVWNDEIHSIPITYGEGIDLPALPQEALMHFNYTGIDQYIERLMRYTSVEALQLVKENIPFNWKNIFHKPAHEFLTRFFVWEGYKDGLHGLVLSILQSFSMLVVQLKHWEQHKFITQDNPEFLDETVTALRKVNNEVTYWYHTVKYRENEGVAKAISKIRAKIRL